MCVENKMRKEKQKMEKERKEHAAKEREKKKDKQTDKLDSLVLFHASTLVIGFSP